jgi:casein kinase II subunit beta
MKGLPRSPRIVVLGSYQISISPPSCHPSVDPWITQFCADPANAWYVPIEPDWTADWFNQWGISNLFDHFDEAIELICDQRISRWEYMADDQIHEIQSQALRIYGMLHARWICQPKGMSAMREKYERGLFGECPRFGCKGIRLLPIGTTLVPRRHSVKLYCPCCCDVYRAPPAFANDGAHFGPAFPHMFLFEYSQYDVSKEFHPVERTAFGFRVRQPPKSRPNIHATNTHETERIEATRL